jgi:hypothetical protein
MGGVDSEETSCETVIREVAMRLSRCRAVTKGEMARAVDVQLVSFVLDPCMR